MDALVEMFQALPAAKRSEAVRTLSFLETSLASHEQQQQPSEPGPSLSEG